jgi:hypothetical protein
MPSTYEPIATTTLGSATATVTFSSITGAYTDLILIANGLSSDSENIRIRFNSDTGTNYSNTVVYGTGSAVASARNTSSNSLIMAALNSTQVGTIITHVQNYSNSTTNKTVLQRGNDTNLLVRADVGLWRNTAAITQIDLFVNAGTISVGSTFTLYGIKAA